MATETRLPPQNLDAERSVLGSVLCDPKRLDEVTAVISRDDFYLDAHKVILDALIRLRDRHSVIDALTLPAELTAMGKLEDVGGDRYLLQVIESVPHAAHAAHHARLVRKESLRRFAIYSASDIVRQSYDSGLDVEDAIASAADKLQMLLERNTDHVETMPQIALRSMDRLTAERLPGISLGFTELDEMLDGAKPAQLILLAARPGVGKSAMAGNIVSHVAKQGRGVFMSSIEMSNDELFDRLLCAKLGVSLKELRPMARCEHDGPKVNEARHELTQLPITCSDAAEQTVSSIGAAARLVKRKHGVELIVVDYLQLVTPSNRRDSRELQVATIAWGLKCLAKQLNVPVLALAQLNREIDKRPDKTPRMSDLRESGALEQHAAVVLFLDRPGLWDQNADPDKAVLHVAKNRGGPVGRVDLKWDGRSATFRGCDDMAGGNDLFDPFENRMDFQ